MQPLRVRNAICDWWSEKHKDFPRRNSILPVVFLYQFLDIGTNDVDVRQFHNALLSILQFAVCIKDYSIPFICLILFAIIIHMAATFQNRRYNLYDTRIIAIEMFHWGVVY